MALPVAAVYSRLRHLRRQAGKQKFSGEKPSTTLYLGVGAIALFKDLLDLLIGFLAGVVTVISFCITFLIWMLLFLFDRSGGGANKQMVRGLILTSVALFEGVGIGFNYLPVEMLSVALLYVLAQRAYLRASKAGAAAEAKQTKAERVAEQQLVILRAEAEQAEQANRAAQVLSNVEAFDSTATQGNASRNSMRPLAEAPVSPVRQSSSVGAALNQQSSRPRNRTAEDIRYAARRDRLRSAAV